MKKAIDFFTAHPARFFLLAALLWGGFMCFLNYKDGADFSWHDLLVEANGLVFDLLVFGVLLSIYEAIRDRKEKDEQGRREKEDKIERLHEEIDDYRKWDEKEATYRIVGAVRRLNKLGVSKIDLEDCFLQGANLDGADLQVANLIFANLQEANLSTAILRWARLRHAKLQRANLPFAFLQGAWLDFANLQGANLKGADLQGANLHFAFLQGAYLGSTTLQEAYLSDANLQGANLKRANLRGSNLFEANLEGTNLQKANLQEASLLRASLEGANLLGAYVNEDWFEKLENWNVKGREEIKEKYIIDEKGRLQEKQ